MTTKIM